MVSRRDANAAPHHLDAPRRAPNAALLIDFDNVTMGIRSDLQSQLRTLLNSEVFKGKISVQRAYADWRRYPQYIVPLSEASIDLIFAPAFGSNKKNATDIRLAIDGLELVFTRPEIGTFILLSGDSDFSSLVLKLKEYGKYVIGIGIRESSSDLLIQNCDEYYSYNELTGLMKEGDDSGAPRKDTWELVVEAAERMQAKGDVMRSDRLKQVMQEIDPSFDEKDAGFSKYGKFLQEIQRRGLLRLTRLDNGQYEISMGSYANAKAEIAAGGERGVQETEAEERSRGRSRRGGRGRGRRPERDESSAPREAHAPGEVFQPDLEPDDPMEAAPRGLVLAKAFELLRRALTAIGAVGDEATDADQAKDRMKELHGADDPLFDGRRFPRFLRQAHDAGVIELVKTDDAYLLKLAEGGAAVVEAAEAAEAAEDQGGNGEDRPSRSRGRRGGRGRGRRSDEEHGEHRPASREVPAASHAPAAPAVQAAPAPTVSQPSRPSRNPRFRSGSRGGATAAPAAASKEALPGPVSRSPTPPAAPAVQPPAAGDQRRSLRGRGSAKSSKPSTPLAEQPPLPRAVEQPRKETPAAAPERRVVTAEEAPLPELPKDGQGSLFKRMSAAFQKALGSETE